MSENLIYIAVDINGLKEVNDSLGHEAGDRLITGAADCIEQCFANSGRLYRVGGDEFVILLYASRESLENMISEFGDRMRKWSAESGIPLSASYGYVFYSEYPEGSISTLARVADERMYAAKSMYYRVKGRDRRALHMEQPGSFQTQE